MVLKVTLTQCLSVYFLNLKYEFVFMLFFFLLTDKFYHIDNKKCAIISQNIYNLQF